jgi:hypothetical protein
MIGQLSPSPREHYYQLTSSLIKSFLTIFSLALGGEQSRGGVWVIPEGTSCRVVIVLWVIRTSAILAVPFLENGAIDTFGGFFSARIKNI